MGIGEATNVTTGKVRLSYVHLFKPYAAMQGQEEKYSVTILVPKSDTDTMARINAAIEAAKQKGISEKWNGVCPPIVPTPVYDGDGVRPSDGMPFGDECKGHWVFTASAKIDYPPEVVDRMGNPIINQSEVYSGMYGRVNVNFFPYAFGGKKGIGWVRSRSWKMGKPCQGDIYPLHRRSEHHSRQQHIHKMGEFRSILSQDFQCNFFCGVFRLRMFKRRRYGWGIIYR